MTNFPCRCCYSPVYTSPPIGDYSICQVCGWEDDPSQFDDPSYSGGANHLRLEMAREQFLKEKLKSKP